MIVWMGVLAFGVGCSSSESAKPEVLEPVEIVPSFKPMQPTWAGRIDSFFQKRNSWGQFNGSVLYRVGNEVFQNAYGYRCFSERDPLTISTPFQLASVSKPITATAALQLVAKGLVSLKDTLQVYFPDFPYPDITIHQLLSHRSGLPNYIYLTDNNWGDHTQPLTMDSAYNILLCEQPIRYYPPNHGFHYCNTNYFLLAYLVEKVTGQAFPTYVEENIFKPAFMDDSYVLGPHNFFDSTGAACGANAYGREKEAYYLNSIYGDKSIYSTPGDLLDFDEALRKGILLPDSLVQMAVTKQSRPQYNGINYGYGWRLQTLPDGTRIAFHRGWWRGFRGYFYRFLDKPVTFIVLTNTMKGGYFSEYELIHLLPEEYQPH